MLPRLCRNFSQYFSISILQRSRRVMRALNMPRPYSALSSNKLLPHAGPRPLLLTVYGFVGKLLPQMELQPVALAMTRRSLNNCVGRLAAAAAGPAEFHERLLEHGTLDAPELVPDVAELWHLLKPLPVLHQFLPNGAFGIVLVRLVAGT